VVPPEGGDGGWVVFASRDRVVSKPVRGVVETGASAVGPRPAKRRHATVSVVPFQLV
jgi:hypothetical protein